MPKLPKKIGKKKMINVCKLGSSDHECPLLRIMNADKRIVCTRGTYVDIGKDKPNC